MTSNDLIDSINPTKTVDGSIVNSTWKNDDINWDIINNKLYRDVISSESQEAWLLWQDPTFIGFIKFPYKEPQPHNHNNLEFELLQDLRLVGVKGEWHIWRASEDILKGRFMPVSNNHDYYDEYYFLWGTEIYYPSENNFTNDQYSNYDGWTLVGEERGMKLWLPWEVTKVPAKIKIRHIIEKDKNTGSANIIDSMILFNDTKKYE